MDPLLEAVLVVYGIVIGLLLLIRWWILYR